MLYDDLMNYTGSDSENDSRIRRKYAAEMAYYSVLEQVISRYAPADSRDIRLFNNDLLSMARDEMAKYASQSGMVRYMPGTDGLVAGFADKDGNEYSELTGQALSDLVEGCFRHSEALHNIVSTYLCSSPTYRGREMTDDEILEATSQEFSRMMDPANTDGPFVSAIRCASRFYGEFDGSRDRYATMLPVYRVADDGSAIVATGGFARGLKISPLVPELRTMRQSGYFAEELGLTAKQGSLRDMEDLVKNNPVLTFDPDKKILYNPAIPNDNSRKTRAEVERDVFRTGVSFGIPEYWQGKTVKRPGHLYAGQPPEVILQPGRQNEHMSNLSAFRMAHIIDSYSYQNLTDDDYDSIHRIFTHAYPGMYRTIFGDFDIDFEGCRCNADAYMDYIEHVCSVAEEHMQSHEFEIHLEPQNVFAREEYGHGYVPLMYFTGERTQEFRRARSNGSKFMSVYPYASYETKNLETLPVMGDAAPAAYAGYMFTKQDHRGSDTDLAANDKQANPYVSGRLVTAEMCESMRSVFDAYVDPAMTAEAKVTVTRVQHAVGETGVKDLAVFINGDGSVNGDLVIKTLVNDMNAIKLAAKTSFKTQGNADLLKRVFGRFREQWGDPFNGSGEPSTLDDAMWWYVNARDRATDNDHGRNMRYFRRNLSNELEGHLVRELRSINGDDIDSFEASRHIFRKYIADFVDTAAANIAGRDYDDLAHVDSLDGVDFEKEAARISDAIADPEDGIVDSALQELYGHGSAEKGIFVDPDVPQKLVLKANMLRNASTNMYPSDYDDLLSLLSYSTRAKYEPDPGKSPDELFSGLDTAGTYLALQLYSSRDYGILSTSVEMGEAIDGEVVDDDRPSSDDAGGPGAAMDAMTDQKAWFDATFSEIGGSGDRTLDWVDKADFSMARDENGNLPPETVEHAIWVATHPLTVVAMRRVAEVMSEDNDGYDAANLGVTPQGVVYYKDGQGRPVIKIGPVMDEIGYVMPVVTPSRKGAPGAVEVDRPVMRDGWAVRDAQGKAQTERAFVTVRKEPVLDRNGRLENPVMFGALNPGDGSVPNRLYGMSMKLRNQDGYHFEPFTERMSFSTYHMNVMENLERSLALYEASKGYDQERMGSARSTMYTAISGNTLRKAYRTNTMIMLDKPMCRAADNYLSALSTDKPIGEGTPENTVANLFAVQARELHDRCVLSKTTEDQNVGLFNQARHLQQGRADRVVGDMDRKNMLRTDCIGARAMIFQDNMYFDPVSTGTARTVGTVAYLSDACRVDRLSGEPALDPAVLAADDPAMKYGARAGIISLGITDVNNGGLDARFVRYPGAQAVDRMQLSMNGGRKSVFYAGDIRFAMVNLGYNMEDGYIVAKRAAHKLGHFAENGRFVPLAEWDKIGDTQSGNKGVVAKIVNTDITNDGDFMADFTYRFIQAHAFNHGRNGNTATAGPVDAAVRKWVQKASSDEHSDLGSYVKGLKAADGVTTVEELISKLKVLQLGAGGTRDMDRETYNKYKAYSGATSIEAVRAEIRNALRDTCEQLGIYLKNEKAEPFLGSYGIEHAAWELFNDNPDLGMAVTNVCVCTRSNPSILMHIDEALEADQAYLAEHGNDPGFDRDAWLRAHGASVLVTRDADGNSVLTMGACGSTPVYVDSHYADDKNKDYTKQTRKAGRGWGMQEAYALLAKHSVSALLPYVTANDPSLPKQLAKLNRKAMMNGFVFDVDAPDLQCKKLTDLFKTPLDDDTYGNDFTYPLDVTSEDGITKRCSARPGYLFIDMDALANRFIDMLPRNISQGDVDAALGKIGESQDFTRFMSLIHGTAPGEAASAKTDAGLRSMFITLAGQYGGAFLLEPGDMLGTYPKADIGLKRYDEESHKMVPDPADLYTMAGGQSAVPLFLSNREVHNSDGDVVSSPAEDRLQFKIFKAELGMALANRLGKRDRIEGVPYADVAKCSEAAQACREKIGKLYRSIPDEKSLSMENMNFWLKKNLYRTTFPNSLTCVWHGDPSLEIDECGISFEKAKSLKLLRPRKDADFTNTPDTYEFMHELYEPLTDDDFVMVNRSPGQTTGCIRALRAKITGPDGDGITIHPALATIFDGDFDGDTVGVINPRTAEAMDSADPAFEDLKTAAMKELQGRMSMKANMVNKAQFTELALPDGGKAEYMHPLFIAGNADLAVALYNMSRDSGEGPRCGYDAKRELDSVTAMANMIEQLRQCAYDFENAAQGKISQEDAFKITGIRLDMAKTAGRFFDETEEEKRAGELFGSDDSAQVFKDAEGNCVMTRKDWENRAAWRGIRDEFMGHFKPAQADVAGRPQLDENGNAIPDAPPVQSVPEISLRGLSKLEERTFHRLADGYRDMTKYMSDPPLMTHGDSSLDIMYNIISDANISKKGKEPQLNALLQFSGMHADCARDGESREGRLCVAKSGGKFCLMAMADSGEKDEKGNAKLVAMKLDRQDDGSYRMVYGGEDRGEYVPRPKMHYQDAVSDIASTDFANAVMMNIIAQSDKADATGIGGSMAQKMQKVLAPMGYGELALRISGPLVQQYLDSKQNVHNCDKNLKIGKTILNKVAAGARINELADGNFANGNAVHQQVYNGQYTVGDRELTAKEYVSQMDNFLQVMRQPGLSPLDRAQFEAVMKTYEEEEKIRTKDPATGRVKTEKTGRMVVGNPIRKADERMDMVYAAIYSGDDPAAFAKHMSMLADTSRGLYTGSRIYDGHVDAGRLRNAMFESDKLPELGRAVDSCVDGMAVEDKGDTKEAELERRLAEPDHALPESPERPVTTPPAAKKICQTKLSQMKATYCSTAETTDKSDGSDGKDPKKPDDIGDDW